MDTIEDIKDKERIELENEKEVVIEEILEEEYLKKDPVKKFQFIDYNKSLCILFRR